MILKIESVEKSSELLEHRNIIKNERFAYEQNTGGKEMRSTVFAILKIVSAYCAFVMQDI